nr:Toll/interleukin-1 receptor (TIR) domain-containing protein [Tanacetum cinerariifolium]
FLSLHETFQADNLVGLDMSFSSIVQIWEGGKRKVLNKLRFLDLSYSNLTTLNLEVTPKLEILNLEHCKDLEELYIPYRCPNLKALKLDGSALRTLDLGLTSNLERLDLKDCSNLVDINAPDGCLENLVYLDLSGCGRFKSFLFDKQSKPLKDGSLSELHLIGESIDICPLHPKNSFPKFMFTCFYKEDPAASSFGNLEKLISIRLCSCTNLESFYRSICSLQCLQKITLEGSIPEVSEDVQQLLEGFPLSIFELKRLNYFHLRDCTLDDLPEGLVLQFWKTLNLKMLILKGCNDLVDLHLQAGSLNLEYLDLSHSKLKTVHLGNTPNLEKLFLIGCNDLIELQMPAVSLKLVVLNSSHSKLTKLHLGNTPNLEELILEDCNDLVELQMPNESLNLKYLDLSHSKLKIYLELSLSKLKTIQLVDTPNLKELILKGCSNLIELQMPDESLNLKYLDLSHSKLKTIQFGNTPNLKTLILEGCNDLVDLHLQAGSLNLEY